MKKLLTSVYFGYYVVLTSFLMLAVRAGVGMQTLGFIIEPMQNEMKWSTTGITFSLTFQLIIAAVLAPYIGKRLDVFGARNILTTGLVANGVMLVLMAYVQQLWQLTLIIGLLGGISQACIGNSLVMPFISKWFHKNRGTMMGIVSSGANLGAAILAPVVVLLMDSTNNWRSTWFLIGWLPIIISPFIYFILRQNSKTEKESTDKFTSSTLLPLQKKSPEISFTVKETLRTPVFWLLIIAWNLADFVMKGALLNRIPFSLEMGYEITDAAGIVVVYGIMAIIGKIGAGWFSDRISPNILAAILSLFQTLGLIIFIYGANKTVLYLAYSVISGLSSGGIIALMPIILAKYYGSKFQGAISGITNPLLLFAALGGPLSASVIQDITGSYKNGFILYIILSVATIILFVCLKRPGYSDHHYKSEKV